MITQQEYQKHCLSEGFDLKWTSSFLPKDSLTYSGFSEVLYPDLNKTQFEFYNFIQFLFFIADDIVSFTEEDGVILSKAL